MGWYRAERHVLHVSLSHQETHNLAVFFKHNFLQKTVSQSTAFPSIRDDFGQTVSWDYPFWVSSFRASVGFAPTWHTCFGSNWFEHNCIAGHFELAVYQGLVAHHIGLHKKVGGGQCWCLQSTYGPIHAFVFQFGFTDA